MYFEYTKENDKIKSFFKLPLTVACGCGILDKLPLERLRFETFLKNFKKVVDKECWKW